MARAHREFHRSDRIGWLRAAVLGANDGVISTASLVVGVAASGASPSAILVVAVAGTVAGALSMAAGEYVSVQSQADTEKADLERERMELATEPERELAELTSIYVRRGLDNALARQVAEKLTQGNALEAHARDELGITEELRARPVQAAIASAASFAVGALVPIVTVLLSPASHIAGISAATALVSLFGLGAVAPGARGAALITGAGRGRVGGALAGATPARVGHFFGGA